MRNLILPNLKRGPVAQGAAILLLLGLLAVLMLSVFQGVRTLAS